MTEKDIIKALKCCSIEHACSKCPYKREKGCSCINGVLKDTLDLINRQQAENEQLTEKFNCQQTVYGDLSEIIKKQSEELKKAKSEAIKEFAERLKKHSFFDRKDQRKVIAEVIIDHYLKRMVGEEK